MLGFGRKKGGGGTGGNPDSPVDLRRSFPSGDINDALSHLLRMVYRFATLQGASTALRGDVSRLRNEAGRCTLPEDYEALCDEIQALELGTNLSELQEQEGGSLLCDLIDAVVPIARAMGSEGPILGLNRLREEAENPRNDLKQALHGQLERLAEGVGFLRNAADVFKLSTLEMIHMLAKLTGDETGAHSRLSRIRDGLERTETVEELEGLRSALIHEASTLIHEAKRRESQLLKIRARVEETQVQVLTLESALKDANLMALTDPLTGLGNRRALDSLVAKLTQSGGDTGIIAVDIDHFKRVNDTFGHDAGDLTLRNLAQVIRAEIRGNDAGFRIGGEEFAIILPRTKLKETLSVAERIRQSFESSRIIFGDREIGATLSAGVTGWVAKQTFKEALKRADGGLYAAKNAGRNQIQQA